MKKLTREDLMTLEQYAEERPRFRAQVLAHKKRRTLPIGPHATLHFEDRLTIQYQVQEMLRIERIFEREAIEEELDAYNPLIPEGSDLKATLLLEYADIHEREAALKRLIGIEDRAWVQVAGFDRVLAIADEDLERENPERTASVHFLRFELTPAMCRALKAGANLGVGIDHKEYCYALDPIPQATRDALVADLD
jgi:hypothetical protein